MTLDALCQPPRRRDPNAKIDLYLTVDEATLPCGFTYVAWAAGTRITTTGPAGAEERTLDHLACVLYAAPYDTAVRGGL